MAEIVAAAVLPKSGETLWNFLQGIAELSIYMKVNHSRFEAKMKTLLAQRDDLKDIITKYKLTEDRTMEDLLVRVMAAEKVAQELERKFRKKRKTSTWIHVLSRSKISKLMANICSDIDELTKEGHQLRNGLILQGTLNEIKQDVKASRVQAKRNMVYLYITSVLICLCLFALFISHSHMGVCPSSCQEEAGVYPWVNKFISSLGFGSQVTSCPPWCREEGVLQRATRLISSLVNYGSHVTSCPPSYKEEGVMSRVNRFISSVIPGRRVTVCPPSYRYDGVLLLIKFIGNLVARYLR